jgi:hypothetical protein
MGLPGSSHGRRDAYRSRLSVHTHSDPDQFFKWTEFHLFISFLSYLLRITTIISLEA